jgi:hypothetical protein
MNLYFGPDWKDEPYLGERTSTPANRICFYCDEPIAPTDSGVIYPDGDCCHKNCHLRGVIGSLAHVEHRCACYVPQSDEEDPPGLTKRQAANAAVEAYLQRERRRVN